MVHIGVNLHGYANRCCFRQNTYVLVGVLKKGEKARRKHTGANFGGSVLGNVDEHLAAELANAKVLVGDSLFQVGNEALLGELLTEVAGEDAEGRNREL